MARRLGPADQILQSARQQANAAIRQEVRNIQNTDFVSMRMWYEPRVLPAAMRQTDRAATNALKQMAKEMNSKLVMRTPINTGLARSSWIASVGEPDTSFLPKEKPYPAGGAPESYGRNTVTRNNRVIAGIQNGDKVFLTNNQKYVAYLEHGRSGQQPSGWIRLTMIEMKDKYPATFRRAFLEPERDEDE